MDLINRSDYTREMVRFTAELGISMCESENFFIRIYDRVYRFIFHFDLRWWKWKEDRDEGQKFKREFLTGLCDLMDLLIKELKEEGELEWQKRSMKSL